MSDITDSVDFSKMTDEELIAYYEEMSDLATMYDLYQLAMKILINSLYGALAEAGFRYFDVNLAEAITTTGQCMIRYIGRCTNGFLNGKLDTDDDYVSAQDTDSLLFSSKINLVTDKLEVIQIGDFFNNYDSEIIVSKNGNEIKKISGIKTPSWNMVSGNLEYKNIVHVMRHKVKKKLYRVSNQHTHVDVTEDHSVIVKRGDSYIEVRPTDILLNDSLITVIYPDMDDDVINKWLSKKQGEFKPVGFVSTHTIPTVTYLGEQEEYVYDLEVEDNHNFFANNILVHNSQYISLEKWVEKLTQGKPFPRNNIIDAIDAFSKKELVPFMAEAYEEISHFTNAVYNKMQMKREAITTSAIWRAKKNYIMFDIDEEGVRYAEPKLKMMGVETAKAATPKFVKESLEAGYRILLEGTEDEFIEHVTDVKKKFYQLHYNDIAFYTGVNGIDEWYDPKVKGLNKWKKGAPAHVKACITHNELLKEYDIKHIPPIKSGNKVAIVALREPNHAFNDRIAYVDNIPEEFGLVEYVDYEKLYEKLYLNPINSFASLIDYKLEKKLSIDSLFG